MGDIGPRTPGGHALLRSLKPSFERMTGAVVAMTADLDDLDPAGGGPWVVFVNQALTRLTGCRASDTVGKSLGMLDGLGSSVETRSGLFEDLERQIRAQAALGRTPKTDRRDHEITGMASQWQVMPLVDEAGQVLHWLGFHPERIQA